jgi:hypothetical protein
MSDRPPHSSPDPAHTTELPVDVQVLCDRFGVPVRHYLDVQRTDAIARAVEAWPDLLAHLDTPQPLRSPSP